MDEFCAMCVDCFQEERHKGHRYRLVLSGRGCCDCGDESAWSPSGMCDRHGRHTTHAQSPRGALPSIWTSVIELLVTAFLEEPKRSYILVLTLMMVKLVEALGECVALCIGQRWHDLGEGPTHSYKKIAELLMCTTNITPPVERLVVSLFVCTQFREDLAMYIANNYHSLQVSSRSNKHSNRNLTSISLSLQLFSVDSIANKIVASNSLLNIIKYLVETIGEAVKPDGTVNMSHPNLRSRLFLRPLMDIGYIIRNKSGFQSLCERPQQLFALFKILQQTQEMAGNTKRTKHHVEYDDESWVTGFVIEVYLRKFIESPLYKHLVQAKSYESSSSSSSSLSVTTSIKDHLIQLLETYSSQRIQWKTGLRGENVPDFRVSKQSTSVHLPLHRTLCPLLYHLTLRHNVQPKDVLALVPDPSILLDPLLRIRAFNAQVRSGSWVRNGMTIVSIAQNYMLSYAISLNDLYHMQYLISCLAPTQFYAQLLDRFELSTWFTLDGSIPDESGATPARHDSGDGEKVNLIIAEEMTHLIISLVCDRTRVGDATDEEQVRRLIIHVLAAGGMMRHSEIYDRHAEIFEHFGVSPQQFDVVLGSVSVFHPPTSTETGRYELRPECWSEWSPHYPQYSKSEVQASIERYQQVRNQSLRNAQSQQGDANVDYSKDVPAMPQLHTCFKSLDDILHCDLLHSVIYSIIYNIASTTTTTTTSDALKSAVVPKLEQMDFGYDAHDFIHNMFINVKRTSSSKNPHSLYALLRLMAQSKDFVSHQQLIEHAIIGHPLVLQQLSILGDAVLLHGVKRIGELMLEDYEDEEDNEDAAVGSGKEHQDTIEYGACAMCKADMVPNKRPFGYIAYVQSNSLLSLMPGAAGTTPIDHSDYDQPTCEILRDVHKGQSSFITFCSHAMHIECHSILVRNTPGAITTTTKFTCLVCRRLANTIVPFTQQCILPPLQPTNQSFAQWMKSDVLGGDTTTHHSNVMPGPPNQRLLTMLTATISMMELNNRNNDNVNIMDAVSGHNMITLQNQIRHTVEQHNSEEKAGRMAFDSILHDRHVLKRDMFGMFVNLYITNHILAQPRDIGHLVKLCFHATLLQSLTLLKRYTDLSTLLQSIVSLNDLDQDVKSMCLPFLRRTAILMSIVHGSKDKSFKMQSGPSTDEFNSLVNILHLNDTMLLDQDLLELMYHRWIETEPAPIPVPLRTHRPFAFASLGQDFHKFYMETSRKACGWCNKMPVGLHAAVCMLCGCLLCHRSEHVLHNVMCGQGIGVIFDFQNITVWIHANNVHTRVWGTIYLDQHGDQDYDKRGNPMHLSTSRLNRLMTELLSLSLQNIQ
ncbi:hypothetical protein SAMD00019534_062070 [Acytostelium subglobosum LB1]|uniref:hypothetical protein n=1 Tax=Acytostelium subglobosum LB1 TaxID=1410327 RepID=UPI000644DA11|nr:hypothetical protein SAMD00019534_062070 [Acytostelium subglobosum LB1]GAM23032.1 hypothetical protein SAMD00019534_062070 [Acytostelium subglobosum LB1]|eukprot:XP_012754259.1 hypothetical protein SAMD00019534_062070 [Acytostelium subglobosum LB1]